MTRIWDRLTRPADADGPSLVAPAPAVAVSDVFRRFWPDARPYRRWIPVGLVLIAAVAVIETVEIWLFKFVVDEVLVPADLGPLPWIALAYLGLALLGALATFGDDYLATWLAERFLLSLRVRVFSHLQRLSLDVLNRRRIGDVIARVTADIQAIESFVLSGVADGLSAVLRIAFFAGALFVLDWQLALVSLVVAPLFFVVAQRFSRLIKQASREKRRRAGSVSAVTEESLVNAALVQAYNRQDTELERFRRENEGIVQAELASTRIRGLFAPAVSLIELGAVMLVLVAGTIALRDQRLTLGGLLVFVAYLTQLYGPVRELSSLSNTVFKALAGAERVIELLDERPLITDCPGAVDLGRTAGVVELDHVTFRYPDRDEPALRDVTLRVTPGETLVLAGPSGAGKSTVARLLLRFYDPSEGQVRMDGHDLRSVTLRSLRSNVAILLQDAPILHGTVRENIAFGLAGATERQIVEAADAAGARELIDALPDGYDTDLGSRGFRLSGGQQQRIAIARALVADTPVLVLDEPSTGLDQHTRAALLPALRRLMRERTTIVISHDLLTARDADSIAVLDQGRVVEHGRHEDLLVNNGPYTRLWATHAPSAGILRTGDVA